MQITLLDVTYLHENLFLPLDRLLATGWQLNNILQLSTRSLDFVQNILNALFNLNVYILVTTDVFSTEFRRRLNVILF